MKKFFVCLFAALLMITCLTGCGSSNNIPVISQSPSSVQIWEKQSCTFSINCQNTEIIIWHFQNPDGSITLTPEGLKTQFPSIVIANPVYNVITLQNVPIGMNGWKIFCECLNGSNSTLSQSAIISVLMENDFGEIPG